PLLQVHVRDHHPLARDQTPLEQVRDLLLRHRVPAVVRHPALGLQRSSSFIDGITGSPLAHLSSGVPAAGAWYRMRPPRIVYTTCVPGISSSGTVMMSRERTTMSASLPGVIEPFSFSSNAAYALFSV